MLGQLALFGFTFLCGAAYECGCVFWVHYSEQGRKLPAVLWSCFNAGVTVLGIESFLRSWVLALAYVAGYGAGTYLRDNQREKAPVSDCKTCAKYAAEQSETFVDSCDECHCVIYIGATIRVARLSLVVFAVAGMLMGTWIGLHIR